MQNGFHSLKQEKLNVRVGLGLSEDVIKESLQKNTHLFAKSNYNVVLTCGSTKSLFVETVMIAQYDITGR